MFPLSRRATGLVEGMEATDCDPHKLARTYRQFRAINALLSGWRGLYRSVLRPRIAEGASRLLDVGCGGGDIPRSLVRWARRDGLELEVTAIDTDPRAIRYAAALEPLPGLELLAASTTDLVTAGERYDLVISNHLVHHLEPAEVTSFCAETADLGRRLVLHVDIVRSVLAYGLFTLTVGPFFHRSYIVSDGLTSIRRAYTPAESRALVPGGWKVERRFPFHQVLRFEPAMVDC